MTEATGGTLKRTPLYDLHVELGGRMVPFAGHEMPVQYPDGILKEHNWTREAAGLFDVSHMGQAWLIGADPAAALENLVPAELQALKPGRQRYSQFLNGQGGILDDLMITRPAAADRANRLYVVVNAACKDQDFALMRDELAGHVELQVITENALLAIQGPKAASATTRLFGKELLTQPFMTQQRIAWEGVDCMISRSGYTGEDGYEISVPESHAADLARALLSQPEVKPIGLGARDSLRLEAGLCLYGSDIDRTTTPVEAALVWSIGKRRREEGGFPGATVVQRQLQEGTSRKRVGLRPEGRAPARAGTVVTDMNGNEIGKVTSGGFGPTVGGPVAMGYVNIDHARVDTQVQLVVRGKSLPARVAKMPFVPQRYYRG